jgi:hypothetical protein
LKKADRQTRLVGAGGCSGGDGMNRPDFDFDPDQQPDLMIAT